MVQQGVWAVGDRSAVAVALVAAVTLAPAPRHNFIDSPTRLAAVVQPFASDLQSPAADIAAPGLADAAAAAALSISDGIIGGYLTIEQWVQYGVDLLSWALRWLPFGGLLASQLNMFYDLGESIVRSMVFNTAYFLDGTVSFGEALSNIGSASSVAFSTFVDAQVAWVHSLLPPAPPAGALMTDPAALLPAADASTALVADLDGLPLSLLP